MKKSKAIHMFLLGTAALGLTACDDSYNEQAFDSNRYASKQECQKEWGDDDRACQAHTGGGYFGPRYFYNHSTGAAYATYSDGTRAPVPTSAFSAGKSISSGKASFASSSSSSVSRGGFGARGGFGSMGG